MPARFYTANFLVPFNFTFDQQANDTNITIQSIGGFTSNPPFTRKSGSFTFNSQGTGSNALIINITGSCPIATGQNCDLYKNEILQQGLFLGFSVGPTQSIAFNSIPVSANDTIRITGYFPD